MTSAGSERRERGGEKGEYCFRLLMMVTRSTTCTAATAIALAKAAPTHRSVCVLSGLTGTAATDGVMKEQAAITTWPICRIADRRLWRN